MAHVVVVDESECPSCGSAPCGPHPKIKRCRECEAAWPCLLVKTVAGQVSRLAFQLEQQADRMTPGSGTAQERCVTLREMSKALYERAQQILEKGVAT